MSYTGRFTKRLCEFFGVRDGAYTALTASEFAKSTFNVKKDIKDILISIIGKENISTPDDANKSRITFRIYNDGRKLDIACYFTKRNKDEMTIYFTADIISEYKIKPEDIWFISEKEGEYYPVLGFVKKKDWQKIIRENYHGSNCNHGTVVTGEYEEQEEEVLYISEKEGEISSPFDPRLVDIESKPMVISNIVSRLKYDDILLDPDFQRNKNLWNEDKQSRLIESLLIKIPLPTFYLDMVEGDKFVVVDGVQRLCAINNFMARESDDPKLLKLQGLEYLQEFNGKTYYELPSNLQRRLNESIIQTYVIKEGTPDKVRNSIFERINTGGLVLQPAEIKNSVYRGRASSFVKRLAESEAFILATNGKINPERMLDREFVNRFLAFYLLKIDEYHENLEDYLNDVLILIKNDLSLDLDSVERAFLQAMNLSHRLFKERAFRKKTERGRFSRINKPLFETVTVELAKISEIEADKLIKNRDSFLNEYYELFSDDRFVRVITNGTASLESVTYRHKKFEKLIKKYLE